MKLFDLFNIRALFFGPALLLLASCGSYQYAGYDQDGIYSSENREAITANDYEESYEDALYYKRLFADQSAQIENLPQGGAIFTNIDSYTSTGAYGDEMYLQEGGLNYQGGNAPWGDQPDEIAINIYNSPFMGGFYGRGFYGRGFYGGGFYGGFYDPFWDPFWGPSWYGPGWNSWNYGYGYHNPWRWNMGWGWNAGWGYNPYGFAYGNPYYYGNPYNRYSRRDVAYNNSRRSTYSDYNSNRTNVSGRASRIQQYSNARNVRADRTSSDLVRRSRSDDDGRTYRTRTSRVESSSSSRSRENATYRSSNSRAYERSTNVRTTRNPRSTSTQVRSSAPSQSRGAVRSSSSTSRSSGSSGTRSSGGSRGGRGN